MDKKKFSIIIITFFALGLGGWLIYLQYVFIPTQSFAYFQSRPPLMLYAALIFLFVFFASVLLAMYWLAKFIGFALERFSGGKTLE